MDTPIDSQPCAGDRLTILDGRRSTAGGMPSYTDRAYQQAYADAEKWYISQRIPMDVEAWDRAYRHASSSAAHGFIHEAYVDYAWDTLQIIHSRQQRKAAHEANVQKSLQDLGPREFTLTYSPSWYATDDDAQNAMRCAIDRLTRYYKNEIKEFHAIGEYTEAGRAHVHGWYELDGGRKITDKNFKRAYPHWNPRKKLGKGHEGGHHATIQRISNFAGYAEKHLEEAWMNINITRNANDDQTSVGTRDPS